MDRLFFIFDIFIWVKIWLDHIRPYHVEPPSFGFRWYLSHPVFLSFGALDQDAEQEEAHPAPGDSEVGAGAQQAAAEARGGFLLDQGQHGPTIL